MKIITFDGSNSLNSINKKLANYAALLFEKSDIEQIDLNDYEVEIFSVDKEVNHGIPSKILELASKVDKVDLLVISLKDNSSYSSVFKNIYDWLSRVPKRKVLGEKPILLLATSHKEGSGENFLNEATDKFSRDGSEVLESFSFPHFDENFNKDYISDIKMRIELIQKTNKIKSTRFKHYYKDDDFTCGIDPAKDDCGDASEY